AMGGDGDGQRGVEVGEAARGRKVDALLALHGVPHPVGVGVVAESGHQAGAQPEPGGRGGEVAIPPGLEPMPLDHSSSPGRGRRSMPVKTMSKKTVPDNSTSSGGSSGVRWAASGSQSARPAASGGAGVEEPVAPVVLGTG